IQSYALGIDHDPSYATYWSYAFRHPGERANLLYFDGHVEARPPHFRTGVALFKSLWTNGPP
ncbi:hypothetical protein HQ590_13595, partial [bacterium]|nr:hypothetical protein [bacterium]